MAFLFCQYFFVLPWLFYFAMNFSFCRGFFVLSWFLLCRSFLFCRGYFVLSWLFCFAVTLVGHRSFAILPSFANLLRWQPIAPSVLELMITIRKVVVFLDKNFLKFLSMDFILLSQKYPRRNVWGMFLHFSRRTFEFIMTYVLA